MERLSDISSIERITADAVKKEPRISALYLHGSAARDELRPGSDIDLAVIPEPEKELRAAK